MAEPTILQSRVPPREAGSPLLLYLSIRFPYRTREEWAGQIAGGNIAVNGAPGRPDQPLAAGDVVAYTVVLREPAVDTNIRILHEETGFVVASKPGQLPSHADGNFITHTFIHLLRERLKGRPDIGEPRLVHRLDRETSGVMVVATSKAAHASLMRQFAEGTVEKTYLAVARGRIADRSFTVEGALGRDPASSVSVRQALVPPATRGARASRTEFEVVRELRDATLVRCVPRTGRTNQIRVHLASRGHPVVGDKLYGRTDEEYLAFVHHVRAGGDAAWDGRAGAPRQLLHAARLAFDHPKSGRRVAYEAPPPDDFTSWVEAHAA